MPTGESTYIIYIGPTLDADLIQPLLTADVVTCLSIDAVLENLTIDLIDVVTDLSIDAVLESLTIDIGDVLYTTIYPYAEPTFTNFVLSGYTTLEVGAAIPAGAVTFTWATSNPDNITADSLSISQDAQLLVDGLANDGTETVTLPDSLQLTSVGSTVFQISGSDTKDNSFSRTYPVAWNWRIYYGESADTSLDTEVEIEALRASLLAASAARTYSFLGGGYKWLAYPVVMGLKNSFTDTTTGFPIAMEVPVTMSLTNQYGITANYYVHRTYNPLGSDIQIAVS